MASVLDGRTPENAGRCPKGHVRYPSEWFQTSDPWPQISLAFVSATCTIYTPRIVHTVPFDCYWVNWILLIFQRLQCSVFLKFWLPHHCLHSLKIPIDSCDLLAHLCLRLWILGLLDKISKLIRVGISIFGMSLYIDIVFFSHNYKLVFF